MVNNPLYFALISSSVVRISSRSQYVGDEAAAWFSTLLDKPGCKLYQLNEPRDSMQDTKWGDLAQPGDKVLIHVVVQSQLNCLLFL